MPSNTVSRAVQISREVLLLAGELKRVNRASIADRQAVLEAIHNLETAAMRWLAEGEN